MDHATDKSVLANFDNQSLKSKNRDGRFFKKSDEFWVEITEHGKQPEEFRIKYTFGFDPLQQYMVEFENGSVQLLPFTWDARSEKEGGQRWYDLYPETTKNDEFYWQNKGQNWNFMCADCHSTDLKKGYDKATNTYETTWKEINVGCVKPVMAREANILN